MTMLDLPPDGNLGLRLPSGWETEGTNLSWFGKGSLEFELWARGLSRNEPKPGGIKVNLVELWVY